MYLAVGDGLLTARVQSILDFLDDDPGEPATIDLYNGTHPAVGAAVTTQTLLATIELAEPSGTIVGVTLALDVPREGLVLASGTVSWARVKAASGAFAFDCDVTETGDGGVITAESLDVYAGGVAKLTSGVFS